MGRQNILCRESALINIISHLMHWSALNKLQFLKSMYFSFFRLSSIHDEVCMEMSLTIKQKIILQVLKFCYEVRENFWFSLFSVCLHLWQATRTTRKIRTRRMPWILCFSIHALNTLTYTFSSCIMGFIFLDFLFSIYLHSGCALVQINEK